MEEPASALWLQTRARRAKKIQKELRQGEADEKNDNLHTLKKFIGELSLTGGQEGDGESDNSRRGWIATTTTARHERRHGRHGRHELHHFPTDTSREVHLMRLRLPHWACLLLTWRITVHWDDLGMTAGSGRRDTEVLWLKTGLITLSANRVRSL